MPRLKLMFWFETLCRQQQRSVCRSTQAFLCRQTRWQKRVINQYLKSFLFQLQQKRTLGREWALSLQIWSQPTIQTTHFSRQDTAAAAAAGCSQWLSQTHCQVVLLVCASKDGVLVQVLPLLFSVMQMQLLVITYYNAPLLLPSLYTPVVLIRISTPYILETALKPCQIFNFESHCWKPNWLNSR